MNLDSNSARKRRFMIAASCTAFAIFAFSSNAFTWGQPDDFLGSVVETPEPSSDTSESRLNLLSLVIKGGYLMIPIGLMSIAVVTLIIERALALRNRRVMPTPLLNGLSSLAAVPGVMDPRSAFRLCQENKSATANVIQSMLLKVGRPQSEVDHAVAEASQREASRLFSNVRWLNLAAAIAPLMGLFGTVWGMIQAFFRTTQLQAGQNKADFLAEGIYVALVTTLGGLAVAIPAAIFAHYFEGRIQAIFHQVEELVFNLTPQIERFEGRMRVSPQSLAGFDDATTNVPPNGQDGSPSELGNREKSRSRP